MTDNSEINKLVIVGGGTAGWISAALLAHQRPELDITLVESDAIGTIGVGEATIPPILDLIATLEIDLTEFVKATNATFKLGIEFSNWLTQEHRYLHPFGVIGQSNSGLPFYDHWVKATQEGWDTPLMAYSPAAMMAAKNKFYVPTNAANTPIAGASYALHLDAGLLAQYLRKYAEARGVQRVEGKIVAVENTQDCIQSIQLADEQIIQGDFFIDCSGFRALLIGDVLNSPYQDWSDLLTVNRAVTVQTTADKSPAVFTKSIAHEYGWSWHIPLQNRTGNGYVFNDNFCDDEKALETLANNLSGTMCNEPRFLSFKTGARTESWRGNCVAIGLSSGFLEPLESTAIHMITRGLKLLLRMFPSAKAQPVLMHHFNQELTKDFIEIRDFLLLHYVLSRRDDTEFWQHYQTLEYPQELKERLALFKERGILSISDDRLFVNENWYAIFEGMDVRPNEISSLISEQSHNEMLPFLSQIPQTISTAVEQLPTHKEFIDRHCKMP